MHNLELKVRCPDEATLAVVAAAAGAAGAVAVRTLRQRDTYFAAPRGRLKLREWARVGAGPGAGPGAGAEDERDGAEAGAGGATLIAYDRPDDAASRVSDYLLCPVADPGALWAALARALGVWGVVEKERRLLRLGNTRIHLDRVAGLGLFVELETVVEHFPGGVDAQSFAAAAEHRRVIAALGLDRLPAVAGSYGDLAASLG